MPKQLLAKSKNLKYGYLSLEQHLLDTEVAAMAIFKNRILKNWCRFFKVQNPNEFLKHLRIAALFHDIGKANEEFYAAVTGSRKTQALRHEWFSALILHLSSVRTWLKLSDLDLEIITAAVLCHHLQAERKTWGKTQPGRLMKHGDAIELFLNHPEVTSILTRIGEIAKVDGLPQLPEKWVAIDPVWNEAYEDANNTADDFGFDIEHNPERNALLLAVKAGLIVADSVASGIFRTQGSKAKAIEQWVEETLHQPPIITSKEIDDKILQPRYSEITRKSKKQFTLKPFQEKALLLGDRVLLLSGCGTGKTIFGYKWHQGVVERYQVGHIIFLYPTRGTATEGFKDYISWAPESDASLLTSTAGYELKEMAENPTKSSKDKDFTTEDRLFALGFWGKRFFSATVDQFLSFLTHNYKGVCLLPVLADSVVVIDEIHSFSRGMFDNLVSFLANFDIPVLCMTATLSKTREQELQKQGFKVFPTEVERSEFKDLRDSEEHPRYHVQVTDFQTARQQAIAAYQEQKYRVLWVVNTVDRCRKIAGKPNQESGLEHDLGVEVLTYHSRFKLEHRQSRHEETIKKFAYQTGEKQPVIAVTTQVCEMSLDLDADILITEMAPISSLVQRFGRANRHLSRGKEFRAQVFVYEPENCNPYDKEDLEVSRQFIAAVSGEVSQRKLAEMLEKYSRLERNADEGSPFVSGGYFAKSVPFRGDENDYTVNALLDSDLNTVKGLIDNSENYDKYILPVPKKFELADNRPDWMPPYLAVVNHHLYCSLRGFGEWKE